jgi:hypothetical protein
VWPALLAVAEAAGELVNAGQWRELESMPGFLGARLTDLRVTVHAIAGLRDAAGAATEGAQQ